MYLFTVNNNIQQYWFIDYESKYPALTSNINKENTVGYKGIWNLVAMFMWI